MKQFKLDIKMWEELNLLNFFKMLNIIVKKNKILVLI